MFGLSARSAWYHAILSDRSMGVGWSRRRWLRRSRARRPGEVPVNETRAKLIQGALTTLRDKGIAGTSARVIAAAAGVNQSLVFYHFGSVNDLIEVACAEATAQRVTRYQTQLREVTSLRELLALGRQLYAQERAAGDVTVLAQVLAGAQQDPKLREAARHAMQLWVNEIDAALQ